MRLNTILCWLIILMFMWESSMTAELNMNISFKEKVIQLLNLLNLESSDLGKSSSYN